MSIVIDHFRRVGASTLIVAAGVSCGGGDTVLPLIAAGKVHTCVVLNGGVQCWGDNTYGQLGNNSTVNSSVPVKVSGLSTGVQAVTAGEVHTCALVNGGVQCWGAKGNYADQIGNGLMAGSLVPVQVVGLTNGVQAVSAGAFHTCAVVNDGVQCWGRSNKGQL